VVTVALAFVAGLLSILSPCVLPLVPIVLGAALAAPPLGAVALAGGLAASFTGLGLVVALAGIGLGVDTDSFRFAAGAVMIVLGAILLAPSWQARLAAAGGPLSSWADRHLGGFAPSGLAGQFAIGLLLGAVWSPCVGPTLGAASLLAAQGRNLPQVALTMASFGIGTALPLVLLGLVSRATLMGFRARLMTAGKLGKGLFGAAFVLVGAAILAGIDKTIEAALVDASPAWLTQLTTSL
jgi:cytochrome c-type biogenesis protein